MILWKTSILKIISNLQNKEVWLFWLLIMGSLFLFKPEGQGGPENQLYFFA